MTDNNIIDEAIRQIRDNLASPMCRQQRMVIIQDQERFEGDTIRRLIQVAMEHALANEYRLLVRGPYFGITFDQMRKIESEIGRDVVYSGDCLFSTILVTDMGDEYDLVDSVNIVDVRDLIQAAERPAG